MYKEPPLENLHVELARRLEVAREKAASYGITFVITSSYRTYEEQDKLFRQGRTAPGQKVTSAKGGFSWHNFGLAVDVAFLDKRGRPTWEGPWERLGEVLRAVDLEWGGDFESFPDRPHVQLTEGLTLSQARFYFERGGLKRVHDEMNKILGVELPVPERGSRGLTKFSNWIKLNLGGLIR